jgi:polar amino acid transport system substrate-binding protein
MIKKSTHRFSVTYGENLPILEGDSQKLEQVIINLIQNACQALTDMNRRILVTTAYQKVSDHVVIEVADEGTGIPEEVLPRIMDPFYTTKWSYGGTGLGLSVSLSIIKEHGGNIDIKTLRGKGSTFRVTLPSMPGKEPIHILNPDDDAKAGKHKHALFKEKSSNNTFTEIDDKQPAESVSMETTSE